MITSSIRSADAPQTAVSPQFRDRPRSRARRFGRLVYLLLVIGFALYLIGRLTGSLVVLNAAGLVTSDRFVVGAAYTARVVGTDVGPGEAVKKGQTLAQLESTEVLATIAQLAQNTALIEARREGVVKRQRVVETILPVARRRLAVAQQGEQRLQQASAANAASQSYRSTVLTEAFEAERDLVTLESELTSSRVELESVDTNLAEVRAAIGKTRASYADGVIIAPLDGTVSATVASNGQVLTAGEPVMELLNGAPYVLAYLESGRLYNVNPGDPVVLTDGVRTANARIERIDIVADNLPTEFRTAFGAYERQQVMRVVSDTTLPFPYLSRVSVVSPWSPTHLLSWAKGQVSNVVGGARADDAGLRQTLAD